MTILDDTRQAAPLPPSWWALLADGARLSLHYWAVFTRPLLLPMLYILVGAYSCLLCSYGFINAITAYNLILAQQHVWLVLGLVLLIALSTLSLFFKGFWQYAVYWTSLNINAQEVLEGNPPDVPAAYRLIARQKCMAYKWLLLAYAALPGLGLIGFGVCSGLALLLSSVQQPLLGGGMFLLGIVVALVLTLLWVLLTIPMSLVFQIMALQPINDKNPLPILKESARLVLRRPWATLSLQVVLFVATNYALTLPIAFLARISYLSVPLDRLHAWMLGMILSGISPSTGGDSTIPPLLGLLPHTQAKLAQGWTDATVMLIATALLLPWGTFVFTLLYRSLVQTASAARPD